MKWYLLKLKAKLLLLQWLDTSIEALEEEIEYAENIIKEG